MFGRKSKDIMDRLEALEDVVQANNRQLKRVLTYLESLFTPKEKLALGLNNPPQEPAKKAEPMNIDAATSLAQAYQDVKDHVFRSAAKVTGNEIRAFDMDYIETASKVRYLYTLLTDHYTGFNRRNKAGRQKLADDVRKMADAMGIRGGEMLGNSAFRLHTLCFAVYSSKEDNIHQAFRTDTLKDLYRLGLEVAKARGIEHGL